MEPKTISGRSITAEAVAEAKTSGPVIGTHDGTHHCDEVVACYLLRTLEEYKNSVIVRTRDTALLDLCDIVVDNGAVFDLEKKRFDHHQREFAETWSETKNKARLSSAGLIWRHFGKRVLTETFHAPESELDFLHEEIYDLVFESIDANDNGVRACECKEKRFFGGMPSMGASISHENTSWILPEKQNESACFTAAYKLAARDMQRQLQLLVDFLPHARDEIVESVKTRHETHTSGRVIELQRYIRFSRFIRRYAQDPKLACVIWREQEEEEEYTWHCLALTNSFTDMSPVVTFSRSEDTSLPEGVIRLSRKSVITNKKETLMALIEKALQEAATQ